MAKAETQKSSNPYFNKLEAAVLECSDADNWKQAVQEWEIDGYYYSSEPLECACGKQDIKHIFSIYNYRTDAILPSIGSSCIARFERDELNRTARQLRDRDFLLCNACKERDISRVEFSSKNYSRDLIDFMYEEGAFEDNKYNMYNSINDRDFLIDMFNRRLPRTKAQDYKLRILIEGPVRKWLAKRYTYLYENNKLEDVFRVYSSREDEPMKVAY